MPEGPVDTIFVEITARLDKLKAGLREAETEVKKSTGIIDGIITKDRLVGVAKTLAGIKVVTEGIAFQMNLWQLAAAKIAGDARRAKDEYNDIQDFILNLPLGVGSIIRGLSEVGIELSGGGNIKDQERDLRRLTAQAKRLSDELGLVQSVEVQSKLLEAFKEINLVKREGLLVEARLLAIENKRRELTEKNLVQIKQAREDATKGELALLFIAERRVRSRVDELIAIEKAQVIAKAEQRIRTLRRDATETFQTALGAATFGSGGFGIDQSPTKSGQDQQIDLVTKTNRKLSELIIFFKEASFG